MEVGDRRLQSVMDLTITSEVFQLSQLPGGRSLAFQYLFLLINKLDTEFS